MRSPYKFASVRCAARCITNCSASKLRDGKQAMLYKYDQLNRITKSRSLAFGSNAYAARSGDQKYDEDYSYNVDGGLTSLQRRDEIAQLKNDFAYSYYGRIQVTNAPFRRGKKNRLPLYYFFPQERIEIPLACC